MATTLESYKKSCRTKPLRSKRNQKREFLKRRPENHHYYSRDREAGIPNLTSRSNRVYDEGYEIPCCDHPCLLLSHVRRSIRALSNRHIGECAGNELYDWQPNIQFSNIF